VAEAAPAPIEGEARLRIDGGIARFPGIAREKTVRFCDLAPGMVDTIVRSAEEACFFDQPVAATAAHPDARTYTLCLTIGARSHEARLSEPIDNPALAKLVATIRRLTRRPGGG
jgi:hypothetical protein